MRVLTTSWSTPTVRSAQSAPARIVPNTNPTTGSHTTDELRASGADVVFQDLSDLDAVLAALEREPES